MMPDKHTKIRFAREAGAVRRLHNRPVVGHYDVAQHCFNILSMLRVLHPEPSISLIWACHAHDLPERFTGDIPAPTKWAGIIDKAQEERVEKEILKHMGFSYELTHEEYWWLKGLDMLEFLMFVKDQRMLGSLSLDTQWNLAIRWMDSNVLNLPTPVYDLFIVVTRGKIWSEDVGELLDYPELMEKCGVSNE